MVEDTKNVGTNPLLQSLQSASSGETAKKKSQELGKEEFLGLLVAQLKNQDPLDPMKNEDFAVQLAQFSQLEQLISINQKVGGETQGTDASSLAGYLGRVVILDGQSMPVENGDGGYLRVNLTEPVDSLQVQILDESGNVMGTLDAGEQPAGRSLLPVSGLPIANGTYSFRVQARNAAGLQYEPEAQLAGVVSGFIPGPSPVLLVGGRQVTPAEIKEVTTLPE